MAILKCKMCGGDLNVTEGVSVCECEYCGTKQTIPNVDDEKKLNLFNRATRLRINGEFDKASALYESLVAEFPEEAEAYWGLVICHYGIEYVDDPATGNRIPTCHRASFDPISSDENFRMAMEYADVAAQKIYRNEAREIDRIREEILSVGKDEKPYDIFICYKETDDRGERTIDSVIAQNVYDVLTEKGYRVFFSRISLEDKLGSQYEPYIFSALNSARIMLAFGTDYGYFHAVWVKNEWSRFLKLMAQDKNKVLIPCYKDMDAYDMPDEFHALQAQDMGKVGAIQDLLRGIEKIFGAEKVVVQETAVAGNSQVTPLLERTFMFLEDKNWTAADEYCEKVLDINPKCAEAYLGKLMVGLKVKIREELKNCALPFDQYNNYQKAMRFGDDALRAELQGYVDFIINRNQTAAYAQAVRVMERAETSHDYEVAAEAFEKFKEFREADELAQMCRKKAEECRKNAVYNHGVTAMKKGTQDSLLAAIDSFESVLGWKNAAQLLKESREQWLRMEDLRKESIYQRSVKNMNTNTEESLKKAEEEFRSISTWKDSAKLADVCQRRWKLMMAQEDYREEAWYKKQLLGKIILLAVIAAVIFIALNSDL